MKILKTFQLALKSIVDNKMRSFLTMLGMIIGVASVIILVGIVNGVSNYLINTFTDMGTNMLTVKVTNTDTRNIDPDEMYDFVDDYDQIFEGMSPTVSLSSYTVKYGTTSLSTTITGVGEGYLDINHYDLSSGRFISYGDIKNRNNTCVIGTYLVDELFNGANPIGKSIKINGKVFTVVGIQEEQAGSEESSTDDCVYIPYSTASRMSYTGSVTNYTFATYGTEYVDQAETILDRYLYGVFKDEDLYTVTSMTQLLDRLDSITSTLGLVLTGIAGISLLVAGIGIMNIMLVSVTERTREIGIRKSLGAKKKDIRWQFVLEAAVISSLGGLLGILIGIGVTDYASKLVGVEAKASITAILISFGVSAGIGIVFGYMPANKAAKLNPIDALRSE